MTSPKPIDDVPQQQAAVSSPTMKTSLADRPWLLALVLVVAVFAAYQPVWHAGFIWDDDDHLTANPVMTAPHGLRMIWSSLTYSRYYPLTLTTFWFERQLWGLNPMPYHLVNIALHAINGILIVLVLRRLRVPGSWLAAFLWVLHPVNVESVAWITELKNTQSAFFFFLSLLCFLEFETRRKGYLYLLAFLCAVAAMLSKPSTVVLPAVLLLCVLWLRRRWQVVDILRVTPFFGLSWWVSTRTIMEQRTMVLLAGTTEWKLGVAERFVIAGKAVWFYAMKLLWPVDLAFVYPHWQVEGKNFLSWLPLAGVVAAGAVLWALRGKGWARACLFAGAYFLLALLPVLAFFDAFFFRYSFVADHFQYLAGIGFIALVATAATTICAQAGLIRHLGRVASTATAMSLFVLTWEQACGYQDNETLWRQSLRTNPNAYLAQNNLAGTLSQKAQVEDVVGHHQDALRYYEDSLAHEKLALRLKPDLPDAYRNVATCLSKLGRYQEATEYCEQAVRIKPDDPDTYYCYGTILLKQGNASEAIQQFEKALFLSPNSVEAHNNLGLLLSRVGRWQEAVQHFEWALRINPNFAMTHDNLV
jgi:tetratricopeptide (TPR) repeat protein